MSSSQFVNPLTSVDKYVDCFHFLATMKAGAINVHTQSLCGQRFFFFFVLSKDHMGGNKVFL